MYIIGGLLLFKFYNEFKLSKHCCACNCRPLQLKLHNDYGVYSRATGDLSLFLFVGV